MGATRLTIVETITNSRGGMMPGWKQRLDPATIKELGDLRSLPRRRSVAATELGMKMANVEYGTGGASSPGNGQQLYADRIKIFPKEAHGRFRTIKWIVMVVTLGIYYICAVDTLGSRTLSSRSGSAHRFAGAALLFLLSRDLAAGILLYHRPAGARGAGAVPRHLGRWARVVRLHLSSDRLDGSDDRRGALLARRPQRAASARQAPLVVRDPVAKGRHASDAGS